MIEKEFLDRVPLNPGRITLVPVDGMENTFDMKRADNPSVEGTPMNKAAFDSIIKSRLTGRFYTPIVQSEEISNITINTNPIPTSGWLNVSKTSATLNGYELFSSPASTQSDNITAAFDGNATTYWLAPAQEGDNYIGFKLPSAMAVTKIKTKLSFNGDSYYCIIQASNNWTVWTNVSPQTLLGGSTDAVEIALTTSIPYLYYRILFVDVPTTYGIFCYSFEISQATVKTIQNSYIVEEFPTELDIFQRFTIVTPGTVSTVGVTSNTLNGIPINIILQPSKYYEIISSADVYHAREM